MNTIQAYEEYSHLYKKLRSHLDLSRVSLEGQFEKALVFSFKKNFKVLIIPQQNSINLSEYPVVFFKDITMIYDPSFEHTNKILKNEEVSSDYKILYAILKSFSKKATPKYYDLLPYPLKKDLEKTFKLRINADKEYFLFGNDELKSRYSYKNLKAIKKNQKVQINDSSAVLVVHNGKRYVDISSSFFYMDDKYIYKDDICKRVKVENINEADITSSDGEKNTYYKTVLKDNVRLSELTNKVRYYKVNGKKFTLIKHKNEFFLKDQKGLIEISHPDLLIYLF
jgi:hypothetical protein